MKGSKIVAPDQIAAHCEHLRKESHRLVFTNGVFDLLHAGHIEYLREARALGTDLIVALNSDSSTQEIKGKQRPLISLPERMEVLAAMEMVDVVTWFEEATPEKIIEQVRPDVLVKGGDWAIDQIAGRELVESYGGKVISLPFVNGYSTTNIVEKILKLP